MNQFLDWISQNWRIILSVVVTIATLVMGGFGFAINLAIRKRIKSQKATHHTICPHCKCVIRLSDMDFILPSGEVDNDLNGVPDEKENQK